MRDGRPIRVARMLSAVSLVLIVTVSDALADSDVDDNPGQPEAIIFNETVTSAGRLPGDRWTIAAGTVMVVNGGTNQRGRKFYCGGVALQHGGVKPLCFTLEPGGLRGAAGWPWARRIPVTPGGYTQAPAAEPLR